MEQGILEAHTVREANLEQTGIAVNCSYPVLFALPFYHTGSDKLVPLGLYQTNLYVLLCCAAPVPHTAAPRHKLPAVFIPGDKAQYLLCIFMGKLPLYTQLWAPYLLPNWHPIKPDVSNHFSL